jgi:hypothetical protein
VSAFLVFLRHWNLCLSAAEFLVVLPGGWGTSLFLVPRVSGFFGLCRVSGVVLIWAPITSAATSPGAVGGFGLVGDGKGQ